MAGDLAAVSFICIAPPTPQGALLWRRRGLEPRTAVLLREIFRLTTRSRSGITVLPRLHIGRALPPAFGAFHPIPRTPVRRSLCLIKENEVYRACPMARGAADGSRTRGPQIGSLMLCQLSYRRVVSPARIAREAPGSLQRIDRHSSCLRGGAYITRKEAMDRGRRSVETLERRRAVAPVCLLHTFGRV